MSSSDTSLMNWQQSKRKKHKMPRTARMTWEQAEAEAFRLLGPSKLTPYDLKVLEKIEREKEMADG